MTHQRNNGTRTAALVAVCGALLGGCLSSPQLVPSVWPPADFELLVEELRETAAGSVPVRRFAVRADGVCLYAEADRSIGDEQLTLPVFQRLCAYRLLDVNTRLLARKLHSRGVLDLDPQQGDQRDTGSRSIRLSYRAFEREQVVVAGGQIHGSMVRVLHVVNAYLPPGHAFKLAGMVGDPEPTILSGVPQPVDDVRGALQCMHEMMALWPRDRGLLLDAFALACVAEDREAAQELLQKWEDAAGLSATSEAPFADPPKVTAALLRGLLPAG